MGTEKGGGEKFYQKPLITDRDGAQERERGTQHDCQVCASKD